MSEYLGYDLVLPPFHLSFRQLKSVGLIISPISKNEVNLVEQAMRKGSRVNFPEGQPGTLHKEGYLPQNQASRYYEDVYPQMLERWIEEGDDPRWLFVGAPSDCKILDYGCGNGQITSRLAEDNNVIGVDLSENFLKVAKTEGLRVIRSDLDTHLLPFPEETFDLVYAFDIYEHLHNLEHALNETARVLKHGGIFMVTVPTLQDETIKNNIEFHQKTVTSLGIKNNLATKEPEVNVKRFIDWVDLFSKNNFVFLTRAIGFDFDVDAKKQQELMRGTPGTAPHVYFMLQKRNYHPEFTAHIDINRDVAAGAWSSAERDYDFPRLLPSLALEKFLDYKPI